MLGCEGKIILSRVVYIRLGNDGIVAVRYLNYSKLNMSI
jgi:hypothetical protein